MANVADRGRETLPEFQKYLRDRKLVAENKTSYFAYWVHRFLSYAARQKAAVDEYRESVVAAYIDELRADERLQEWQPRQADEALKLYYFHDLGKSGPVPDAASPKTAAAALSEMTRLIRLKHYAYSTERSYLQWGDRFSTANIPTPPKSGSGSTCFRRPPSPSTRGAAPCGATT